MIDNAKFKTNTEILNEIGNRWFPKKIHPVHKRKIPKSFKDFMELPFDRLFTVTGRNLLKPSQLSTFIKNFLWMLPRNNDVIWATNPRSGYNWTLLILHYLIANEFDIEFKLKFDIRSKVIKYNRTIYGSTELRPDWNELCEPFRFDLPIPRLMHTHKFNKRSLNSAKILLQIRNPIDCIVSLYYHPDNNFYPHKPMMAFLLESSKPLQTIEFLNSWGHAIEKYHLNHLIVKYEILKEKPIETIKEIVDFTMLPVKNMGSIEQAIEQTSISKVKKIESNVRGNENSNLNFYARKGGSNYIRNFDEEVTEYIKEMINKNLKYDFGYKGL